MEELLAAIKASRERNTVKVETIASDPRQGGTYLSATLKGKVQFTVPVQDSSVSRSSTGSFG